MNLIKITQPDSEKIYQNVIAKALYDILDEMIDEGNIQEVLDCLEKNVKNTIPGSYLMYMAFILNNAQLMIRNVHAEDPIIKAVCQTEQEIIQF